MPALLNHEPVVAGPPTTAYRVKKFVRRNRGPVIAGSLVLLALVVGIIGTAVGLRRALVAESRTQDALADVTTQKDRAEKSATESKLVLGFFKDRVLAAARPKGEEGGLGKNATIREALDAAEPEIAKAFADQPAVEASILNALASTYFYLDESARAIEQFRQAAELRQTTLGPDHRDTLTSIYDLGTAFFHARRFEEALPLLEKALELRKITLGPNHAETLESRESLASAYATTNRLGDAISMEEETLALCKSKLGADNSDTLICTNNLAVCPRRWIPWCNSTKHRARRTRR
jgi:tetratricopeptide (TPR) repeat protein